MTLSELITHLQEMQEDLSDGVDPVIKIAYQPSWPLEESVSQVEMYDPLQAFYDEYGSAPPEAEPGDDDNPAQDHWNLGHDNAREADRVIFFAGGFGGGYLTYGMASQLGWR